MEGLNDGGSTEEGWRKKGGAMSNELRICGSRQNPCRRDIHQAKPPSRYYRDFRAGVPVVQYNTNIKINIVEHSKSRPSIVSLP